MDQGSKQLYTLKNKVSTQSKQLQKFQQNQSELNHSMKENSKHLKSAKLTIQKESVSEIHLKRTNYSIQKVSSTSLNVLKNSNRAIKSPKSLQIKKDKLENQISKTKEELKTLRKEYRKKVSLKNRGDLRTLTYATHRMASNTVDDILAEEGGVLADLEASRKKFKESERTANGVKKVASISKDGSKWILNRSYGLGNRTYNFMRGRGFTRTPNEFAWYGKFRKQLRNIRARMKFSKAGKAASLASKSASFFFKPFILFLKNPLSLVGLGSFLVIIFILSLFMSFSSTPVVQSEFELNDAWLHVSKRDRENSNSEVDYWTNIDDMMIYMGYRYGSWNLKDEVEDKGFLDFSDNGEKAVNKLWDSLNKNVDSLKTMKDLYSNEEPYKLSEDDLKEYQEYLDNMSDIGYYLTSSELHNPFYAGDDEKSNESLTIIKRFGYADKDKIFEGTVLKASPNQNVLATMAGTVSIDEEKLTIKSEDAEFEYSNLTSIRVKDGEKVDEGSIIGSTGSENQLEISYRKLDPDDEKWKYVNPGFYFTKVTYSQTTSVIQTGAVDGDVAAKSKKISDYIKSKLPGATDVGIAAMLGNFATESNLTAKRAEGDYLSPPIGATDSSWDDPAWLELGGLDIYGKYPNIVHRGLGLGQWTNTQDGSVRHTLLREFATAKSKKWYDLELQMEFLLEGDSPFYRETAKQILTSNDDLDGLTLNFLVNWEGNPGDKILERQSFAKQILASLKGPIISTGILASGTLPEEYKSKLTNPPSTAALTSQPGSGYPVGQCTWYTYNRLVELGSITDLSGTYGYLGNGQDWVNSLVAKGWKRSAVPVVGAVVSTLGGFDGTPSMYGHVAVVEYVNPDGSFLVSECNIQGVQDRVTYSVRQPNFYYSYAVK
ncbi:TPA: phage tail tip lysozyme [Streptococcus suis]